MITKGIVIRQSQKSSNKYLINMPAINQIPSSLKDLNSNELQEASLSSFSGVTNQLQPGDIVFVGFEDHDLHKPVILGKLYTDDPVKNELSQQNAQYADLMLRTLVVTDERGASKAVLPENTTIGNVSPSSLQALEGLSDDNLERRLEALQNEIEVSVIDKLSELTDVSINEPVNGQVLKYNSSNQKWINADETAGGGNDFNWQQENLIITTAASGDVNVSSNLVAELEDNVEGNTVSKQIQVNSNTNISNGGTQFTISPIVYDVTDTPTINYTLTHYEYSSPGGVHPVVESVSQTLT